MLAIGMVTDEEAAKGVTTMGSRIGRFWHRRKDVDGSGESSTGPPQFAPEQADEIRALLHDMSGKHGEERARIRRRLRSKGFHIGDFPDVDDWSAEVFDQLVSKGRVIVGKAEGR